MKLLFVRPNKDGFGFKPIGIALLSALAKKEGWEVKLFDTSEIDFGYACNTNAGIEAKIFKPIDMSKYNLTKKKIDLQEEFRKIFRSFRPDILAFSVLSDERVVASKITKTAKSLDPKIPVIWGGKYPTLNPESTLLEEDADYVCIGEGLEAFPEFLRAFEKGGEIDKIRNIWVKKEGKIIKNSIRPIKQSLNDLPYLDWEIFDRRHFYKPFDGKMYIGGDHMLNWGCPYNCTYCINKFYHDLYDNKYIMRRYNTKRIIDELVFLKEKYKLEFFKFHDEDFLMRPLDGFKDIAEQYKKRVGLPFVIETNPKTVNEERTKILKEMGCASVSLAIETGDQGLRKNLLNRVDTKEDIIRAFGLMNKFGIRNSSFNMLAIPFETRETYWETVKVNRQANTQYPNMGFFFPFEMTALREIAIKEGLFEPEGKDKYGVCERNKPSLHFKNLSEEELIQMFLVFNLYVKLPTPYEKFILRSEKLDHIGKKLRKKLLEIFDETVWKNDGWYKDNGNEEENLKILNNIMMNKNEEDSMKEIMGIARPKDKEKLLIIGLIPARGGSKGIPRKNIKPLAGKPLIVWSIESAKESKLLTDFFVSTDDEEIASVAIKNGAKIIKRPAELATDNSNMWDVIKHAISITKADVIVLLQPTSPIREKNLIDKCIKEFIDKDADNLATGFECKMFEYGTKVENRQKLEGFFHDDGNVYILKSSLILAGKRIGKVSVTMDISREQNLEIDDEFDFWINEQILLNRKGFNDKK